MHRCGSWILLSLIVILVAALSGCLGKSSGNTSNEGVTSVSLSPSGSVSLDVGGTQVFSATGKNATGGTVLGVQIQFVVSTQVGSSASAPVAVANNGNACAGTWDLTVGICSPGTPGIALVTAVINGVSSTPTTVYVHQHISSIQISRLDPQGPPLYDCFSQSQTWNYAATAYSGTLDITNTVGPLSWSSTNTGVVTETPLVVGQPPTQQFNQVEVTAKAPGITQLFASVSGTNSSLYPFTTCLVQAIYLQIGGQSQEGNSITINSGSSLSITATAVDTLYQYTGAAMPSPPLTWSTTNPEVALFTTTTNTTAANSATIRNNLGGATLTASCSPPTCNIGLPVSTPAGIVPSLPIYSSNGPVSPLPPLPKGVGYGSISVDVTTTTSVPTYAAWVASTGCQDASGCTSALFSVTPGNTPIGAILTLPRTPNSLVFNHLGAPRLYIGSKEGLMYVDVAGTNLSVGMASGSETPCNVALCGTVLTVSNDGKLAVVSDTVSTPSQVYIFNGGSTPTAPVDLVIPGEAPVAAAFSPDQLKLFILTNTGNMYVYSTVDALAPVPVANSVTALSFSADGSFAYVAGTPASSVSAFSTCAQPGIPSVNIGTAATSSTPVKIFPSPVIPLPIARDGFLWTMQNIIALEPPNVELLTTQFRQDPIGYSDPLQLTCNPPVIPSAPPGNFTKVQSFNLGQGNLVPIYSQLTADGTELILVAQNIPAVLIFSVSNGTTTSIPLVNNAAPFSASASTDGSQVYVAACDQYDQNQTCTLGTVHIVNTISQGDFQQVPYINAGDQKNNNMCNGLGPNAPLCIPNLVAIRPE